jgi:hypothetical protein
MEDILREPVEMIDEDLDAVAGGRISVRVSVEDSHINGGGNNSNQGGVSFGNVVFG